MIDVINHGCRLNIAEGEAIRTLAAPLGSATIINSCAVTNESVRQARQAARGAFRTDPSRPVIVTGCAATSDAAAFAAMPEVARVVPVADKLAPATWGGTGPLNRKPVVSGLDHARAFVEVQTGCDHSCTFCIITHARGPNRSFAPADIVRAIAERVEAGCHEAVLTGVDTTSYEGGLGHLVRTILREVPTLSRLRLSSLDPAGIDPILFALFAEEDRLMPHLHLSLQSGDDLILKRMKRRHSRAQAIALVAALKAERDIAVGADLIAGFPTESETAHANSLAILDECNVVHPHIFPFSPRTSTPAARMPQLSHDIVRSRAAELRHAAETRRTVWLDDKVGQTATMLIERDGRSGHLPDFASARLTMPVAPNTLLPVRLTGRDGTRLIAQPA
ncbi:Threonylcarbamoyladenosine tRNA methylthiotransferase MtaB [Sphingomonas antarctica]|uniref:radical SAM protein n=1 Tax=Sphingomonas antarctica TaxID=2040274 RepID=UPI0039EA9367